MSVNYALLFLDKSQSKMSIQVHKRLGFMSLKFFTTDGASL